MNFFNKFFHKNKLYLEINVNNVVYNFDFTTFMNNAIKIYEKFIPPTKNNTTVEKLDKLFINFLEEYNESYEANQYLIQYVSNKNLNFEDEESYNGFKNLLNDYKLELIDMMCYAGTMLGLWNFEYDAPMEFMISSLNIEFNKISLDNKKILKDIDCLTNKDNLDKYIIERSFSTDNTLYNITNEFSFDYIKYRTLFSNRKWHKPKESLKPNDEINIIGTRMKNALMHIMMNIFHILILIQYSTLYYECKFNKELPKTIEFQKDIINSLEDDIFEKQQVTLDL